ncbi:MAG: tandem-95 repeat protein [Chloroflexota bacterium]|nr:tandem-95 repeat protein [Chloroflexota bacterium]
MKTRVYSCVLIAFVLVMSGAVLFTGDLAHASSGLASVAAAEPTCVTIQRGTFGEVADGYIWEASPETNGNSAYLYTGSVSAGEKRSLIRFDLDFVPEGAAIQSATFGIQKISQGTGETVTIHRITEPWNEGEPTWNNFADNYDDTVEWGSFVAAEGTDVLTTDVFGLVSVWADGEEPNYGLMLMNLDSQVMDRYASSETGDISMRPWLEVCYAVNNDPTAEDDSDTTDEDTPVVIDVLANDSDPDGDDLTVSDYDVTSTEGGTVDCTSAGMCTYTPPADFGGSDTFDYTISDGYGGSDTATVTVTVNLVNDPPVAVDDADATDEDTPVIISVTANDTDVDGTINPATVTIVDEPSDGSVSVDPVSGDVTYSPDADFNGSDSFTYTVEDDEGAVSNVATVTVTVAAANDPPVAVDDSDTTDEDTPVVIDVLANDSDPDGDDLTVSDYDVTSTEGGTVDCTSAGLCTYTPPAGFSGSDTFGYTISDGHGGSDTATVTVTVVALAPTGHALYIPIVIKEPRHYVLYLPIIGSGHPDLVVESIIATSDSVQVIIKNQGDVLLAPYYTSPAFALRVDLYIDPDPAPTGVNQTWDDGRCDQGIVWIIPNLSLSPGGTIALTIGDAYYQPSLSNFGGSLPEDTPVYAQVDSYSPDTTYGAVLEDHETIGGEAYNNITGPVFSVLSAAAMEPAETEPGPFASFGYLASFMP